MNSSNVEILKNITVIMHRYLVPIIYLLGNIGCILSAIIFSKKCWKKNICVFYFNNCILINLFYINTTMFGSILKFGFHVNSANFGSIPCKIFYYISYLLSVLLPNILILASIDRLLISSQNVNIRLYSSRRLAYLSVSLSTLFWMLFYSHTLIKIDIYKISQLNTICYYDISSIYFEFISYSTLIIAIIFGIGLIILSIFALKNVHQIRSIPRHKHRQQIHMMHKRDFQLLRCLYAHDIVFIIFNIYAAVYYVYIVATRYQIRTMTHNIIDEFLEAFGLFIHHIPYCLSFILFIIFSKIFQLELKRIFNQQLRIFSNENDIDMIETDVNVVSIQ